MKPRIRTQRFTSIEDVFDYANYLLNLKWELPDKKTTNLYKEYKYKFVWDKRAKKRLGYCDFDIPEIGLNQKIIELNLHKKDIIRDVLLHEIAHALAFVTKGEHTHGKIWKEIVEYIGGTSEIRYKQSDIIVPPTKYILICNCCKNRTYRDVLNGYDYSCMICNKKGYDPKFKLDILINY